MNVSMNTEEKREGGLAHNRLGDGGFTLLELLIVVSIIAILSVALVLVLNPAEALKKSRDAQRMSDLSTIKTALGLMLTSTSTPSLDNNFASAGTVCTTGYGTSGALSAAPKIRYSAAGVTSLTTGAAAGTDSAFTPWTTTNVTAATAATAGDVNGGWIPAVLSNLTGGSPISNYPIDPTNTVSAAAVNGDLVYRYACQNASVGGKPSYIFEIDATLESDAYTITDNKRQSDGGDNTNMYEVGTSLKLLPITAASF